MGSRTRAYHGQFAHRQQDSSYPVPHTPPHQPPYHVFSPQMPSNSRSVQGYPSPLTPSQPGPSYQSLPLNQNHRNHVSTVASPTPPASSHRPSFSTRTSMSESTSGPHRFFCVHHGCNKTFASWSVLIKHEREKHVKRVAICNRCLFHSPRKHRHPSSCTGVLAWREISKVNGYPCGGCERRFDNHGNWCKHIKDHQLKDKPKDEWDITWAMRSLLKLEIFEQAVQRHPQGHLVDRMEWNNSDVAELNRFETRNYENDDPSTAVAHIIGRAIVPQNHFNPSWWVEPTQPSSSTETQIPTHQMPVSAEDHTSVERDLVMTPSSQSIGSPTSPLSLPPDPPFHDTRSQQAIDTLDEFDTTFSEPTAREVPATNFDFRCTSHQNPLPETMDPSSSEHSRHKSSHTNSRSSPSLHEDSECAVPSPPSVQFIDPRLLFSDTGSLFGEINWPDAD